jgi:hypothetical protein
MNMQIKIKYDFEKKLNCGKIIFNNKILLLDMEDLFRLLNKEKKFNLYEESLEYPYYMRNKHKVTIREYLYKFNDSNIYYEFKNKNKYDLRRLNVSIYHNFHKILKNKYNILSYKLGHIIKNGRDAYSMKNPIWTVKEKDKDIILMYCEKDTICKLCPKSYQKIIDLEKEKNNGLKITFYKHSNGYILGSGHNKFSRLYIHQIIKNCFGNGKGTKKISVDHIDQDPLNNTYDNLRLATRKEQEQNSNGIKENTKRNRKKNAIKLPDGITQDMIPKYVYYCKEIYNKEKNLSREFFRIEKHPNLEKKCISGSKSNKLSIIDKLNEIKNKLKNLDNNIKEEKSILPKYYNISILRNSPHFVYDRRDGSKRYNLKMKIKSDKTNDEELKRFTKKLFDKYPELNYS